MLNLTQRQVTVQSPAAFARQRVLVIDDDDTHREFMGTCLAMDGYEIEVAGCPAEGAVIRAEFKPDLVVMDIQMPGMDGFELLERWHNEAPVVGQARPSVIFVSSLEERGRYRRAMQLGATDFLIKPFSRTTFMAAARVALANSNIPGSKATHAHDSQPLQTVLPAVPGLTSGDAGPPANIVPGYQILRTLGRGGNATVYLALHCETRTRRALKVLNPGEAPDSETISRFIEESAAVRGLNHPGIVRVLDQGVSDQILYLAMEYLPGGDLRAEVREGIAPAQAVAYALRILDALSVVHAHGLVHRDLKPANLLLRGPGDLVLSDFGIAKRVDARHPLTQVGHVVGTLNYMSPEQAAGQAVDPRSDLYSVGVVLAEMLTGKPPFTGASIEEIIARILLAPAPTLPVKLACLQPVLDQLVAKDKNDRPASANAAHNLLAGALHELFDVDG